MMSIIPESLKNIRFVKIFQRGFSYLKFFTFRLEFTIEDYQNKNIPSTWKTFRRTIMITLMTWTTIFCLGLLTFFRENHPFMSYSNFETILKTDRMDLFTLALFIMVITLEVMFLHLSSEVLNYRSSLVIFIIKNNNFDENELSEKSIKFLSKFYTITYLSGMIAYRLYIINGIATIAIAYYWAIIFYKENLITLKESILSMFAFGLIVTDLTYLIGQLFMTILLFIIFVIELFQVKLGELYKFVQKMFDHYSTYNGLKTIFWNQFQNKYVKLYAEIVDFNNSFDVMLFYIETVSKSSIIISCMFYSKQKEISQYCIMVIVSLMSTFICVTILYSRVARLPSYNRRCCKSIMNWLARTQWSSQESKFHSSMNINSMIIKSNFFAQVISDNKLGFTCGHLFFITKFKYIQLIILNMLLIILFYQKICINGSF